MSPNPPHLPCLAIVGPTASGKSAAALALARQLPCEIISMDSAQVYIGMDIGTAKPGAAEREAVPHHLIDVRDPSQAYSAALFADDAGALIRAIRERGRIPLLVGGTLLYLRALMHGLDAMPPAQPDIRLEIEAEARARGWPALHAELARVDPVTAARLAPADSQRVQRALEVWRATGRALSSYQTARRSTDGKPGTAPAMQVDTVISIEPLERAWLHERIAQRFSAMLEQGLVAEVQALRARGDLDRDMPSMRCVGYRQVWDTLEGEHPPETLAERGIQATRQLAKRQLTWLRSMPAREQIAADGPNPIQRVLDIALATLERAGALPDFARSL